MLSLRAELTSNSLSKGSDMSATVRINPDTHAKLKTLCDETGESIPTVLDKAIEDYRRKKFLNELAMDFARLKSDPKAWADVLEERAEWDATLVDGLKDV